IDARKVRESAGGALEPTTEGLGLVSALVGTPLNLGEIPSRPVNVKWMGANAFKQPRAHPPLIQLVVESTAGSARFDLDSLSDATGPPGARNFVRDQSQVVMVVEESTGELIWMCAPG